MSTPATPEMVPIFVPEFDQEGHVIYWYKFYLTKAEVERMKDEALATRGRGPNPMFADTKTNIAQPKALWPFIDEVVIDLGVPGGDIQKMKQKKEK